MPRPARPLITKHIPMDHRDADKLVRVAKSQSMSQVELANHVLAIYLREFPD